MTKETWKLVHTSTNIVCGETEFTFSTKKELSAIYEIVSKYFGERKFHVERVLRNSEIVPEI